MSEPTTSVGEMEIACTADFLKTPIHILQDVSTNPLFIKYKDDYKEHSPIFLVYSAFGDCSGHYDCLIPSAVQEFPSCTITSPTSVNDSSASSSLSQNSTRPVHVADISPFPCLQTQPQNRKRKTTEAEVITSSPYKRKLSAGKKRSPYSRKEKKNVGKKKTLCKSIDSSHSWFCFMCRDTFEEDMIQCQQCLQWVHENCAGAGSHDRHYTCEMCRQ